MEKQTTWAKILEHLKTRVDEREFDSWFRDSRQKSESAEAIFVQVRTPLFVDYIPEAYAVQIAEAARLAGAGNREIRFGADGEYRSAVNPQKVPSEPRRRAGGLNPAYTFEHFVTGESNRLAHAAAQRVA
ncbi:MAG: DnaA N-terminal domain-containing protein, partial [Thermoanaerobaculia bacterium]